MDNGDSTERLEVVASPVPIQHESRLAREEIA